MKPVALSLREYAKRRGCSHQAVMKAIATGRLQRSLTPDQKRIADPELADREWKDNTDPTRQADAPVSIDTPDGKPPADTVANGALIEKYYRAQFAKLKFQKAAGELVDAREVQALVEQMIIDCRSALLGLPSRAKQSLQHLTKQDVEVLDALVRESLEGLVPQEIAAC